MKREIEKEIIELHKNFQDWYRGDISKTTSFNKSIENHFDKDFHIVFPDATQKSKKQLCTMIFRDYKNSSDFSIVIKKIKLKELSKEIYLARYEEWQSWKEGRKKIKKGMKTASILKINSKKKVKWIHIHETLIKI